MPDDGGTLPTHAVAPECTQLREHRDTLACRLLAAWGSLGDLPGRTEALCRRAYATVDMLLSVRDERTCLECLSMGSVQEPGPRWIPCPKCKTG